LCASTPIIAAARVFTRVREPKFTVKLAALARRS